MLWGGELVLRDGVPAGQVTSAAWGETVGACVALAYLRHDGPVTADLLAAGGFEVDVAGERFAVRASLRAPLGLTRRVGSPAMVASRSARERKAAVEAGPLATVKIDVDGDNQFAYRIGCTTCVSKEHRKWSTLRKGDDNGYMAAMDRWIFHLIEKHPGAEAPCLAYLEAAQQRLHERREQQA